MTKILKCKCPHEFQDKQNGKGNRIHNACQGKNVGKWRCTVCGDVKESN